MNTSIVLHIPHSSTYIPQEEREKIILFDEELKNELLVITDWYTDELFIPNKNDWEAIIYPVSRLVVDPERFINDDLEIMSSRGMGVIYTKTSDGKILRNIIDQDTRKIMLEKYYFPHYERLNRAVSSILTNQDRWHFVNVKFDGEDKKRKIFRRITIGPEERLRTASERIAIIDLENAQRDLFGISPIAIQTLHDEAFDVEAVTKQFFNEYKVVFDTLQRNLTDQTNDKHWAHDFALQFLNRCMFLYFIQRKGWLGGDREFLRTLWETYNRSSQPPDTFVDKWLKVMFFEAFNGKPIGAHRYLPDNIRNVLSLAPYLNGGLFTENELDRKYNFKISDNLFREIFTFLERYNFTISEDSPLDQEVAVDPEMIGKVYESLVNVSEEASERGDAGIFYTPRIEITLMCRLALVDYLANHMGDQYKSLLYELVFAIEPDDKETIDKKIETLKLWDKIYQFLKDITVLDPACGSGSFLLGMLQILDDLEERAQRHLGITETPYNRRKRIIGESLYGVDVMDWACHVAELRLWLSLIADSEFDRQDLHIRHEPLLPHFSFKIRCGDSLVQEVGGINFGHTHTSYKILPPLKARITNLKNEKLKFYNNDPDRKFRSIEEIKHEELKLFQDILDSRAHKINEEINKLHLKIEKPQWRKVRLDGTVETEPQQMSLEVGICQKQIDEKKLELEQVENSRSAIKKDIFVWDISFVEIFEGDKEGFDIVIGHPPYVRQENISHPKIPKEKVTTEIKKAYKEKLARSVYNAFPHFFSYNQTKDKAARRLDAKSDLYIYFYFYGLSLLNPKGSFCFITSNSWLDVGYGKDLQEFLLKHCHVKMIIDNQVKRSFASADVNTVIALFSAPDDRQVWALDKMVRFVMFKVPFEHILSPVIFEEIEEAKEKTQTNEYRLFPVRQEDLLKDGIEQEEDDSMLNGQGSESQKNEKKDLIRDKKPIGVLIKSAKYIGNKWGGKYLRAPDIYWTILEKGKGKLVRLGDIAEVRRGFTTGANEFFYLDEEKIKQWGIEEEFLKPVIKSPRECKTYEIDESKINQFVFYCNKLKKEIKGTGALEYIIWGEREGFNNRPTCQNRQLWYDLGLRKLPTIFTGKGFWDRIFFCFSANGILNDQQIYGAITNMGANLCALLNTTYISIFLEILGRSNFGEGILWLATYEIANLPIISPTLIDIKKEFNCMTKRNILNIFDEITNSDRRSLDSIIFDALNLTQI